MFHFRLGTAGASALAEGLKACSETDSSGRNTFALTTLELNYNDIGNGGFTAICDALAASGLPVETVGASGNGISDLAPLIKLLTSGGGKKDPALVNINLDENSISSFPDELAKAVQGNPVINGIQLTANELSSKSVTSPI